jgi:hypothetical protein
VSRLTGDPPRLCGGGNVKNTVRSGDAVPSMLQQLILAPAPFENNTARHTCRSSYGAVRNTRVLHLALPAAPLTHLRHQRRGHGVMPVQTSNGRPRAYLHCHGPALQTRVWFLGDELVIQDRCTVADRAHRDALCQHCAKEAPSASAVTASACCAKRNARACVGWRVSIACTRQYGQIGQYLDEQAGPKIAPIQNAQGGSPMSLGPQPRHPRRPVIPMRSALC